MADVDPSPAGGGRRPPAAARPEAIKAIPIRHWGRWISAAVIIYVVVALLVSFLKNPNTDCRSSSSTCSRRWCCRLRVDALRHVRLDGRRHRRRHDPRRHAALGELHPDGRLVASTSGSSAARRCWCRSSSGATSGRSTRRVFVRPARSRISSSVRSAANVIGGRGGRHPGPWVERGGLHGRVRARRHHLGRRRPDRGGGVAGHGPAAHHAAHRAAAGHAGDHPRHGQRDDHRCSRRRRCCCSSPVTS